MAEITKYQIEEILRRMELSGASFIDIDVLLESNCFDETWVDSISIDEYSESGQYLDTIMKIKVD